MPYTLSIPATSLSEDSKPYTIYALTIRTPLRTTVLPKRYSDFETLHSALINVVGTAPPAPLPGKAWSVLGGWSNFGNLGGRTVNNPELTEKRRQGLEEYIRSIEEGPDPRWRDSNAWRAFLGFGVPANKNNGSKGVGNTSTDKSVIDEAELRSAPAMTAPAWLDMHTTLRVLLHDARSYLARRDSATTPAAQHDAATQAKKCLVRANTTILKLDDALTGLTEGRGGVDKLGEGEVRRRRDLLRRARKEREGLDGVLSAWSVRGSSQAESSQTSGQKEALFGAQSTSRFGSSPPNNKTMPGAFPAGTSPSKGSTRTGRVLGGPAKETNRTRELDNEGVVQLQRQIMREQDQDVEELNKAVLRMKQVGIAINEELNEQKPLLEILDEDVSRVGAKIDIAKNRIKKIK